MIEIVIKEYLDGHLSVPSFLERPKNPPEQYVIFEKTSSSKSNYLPAACFSKLCSVNV